MAITIENQKMVATINEHGAELVSLINKTNGKNICGVATQSIGDGTLRFFSHRLDG